MNRYQKIAWFNLIVITITIIITSAAIAIEFHIRGYSEIAPWFVGILALLRLKPFLFKKPQGQDKVISDERDNLIIKRASSFAYTTFWIVFFILCFLLFLIIGPKSSVPTITLPLMAFGGALFMKIVCSVAILIQYGWGGKDNE
jgi:FtsH-binding integral membrane protein